MDGINSPANGQDSVSDLVRVAVLPVDDAALVILHGVHVLVYPYIDRAIQTDRRLELFGILLF